MYKLLIFFLIPFWGWSQTTISDDFSDGDFMSNPAWEGDTARFEVDSNFELHLKDVVAGQSYLSTASPLIYKTNWEFLVKMAFNPSTSNYCRVYLVSNQANVSGNVNGYYVRLGGSSADRISLYKQNGTSSVLLAESTDDWLDESEVNVRISVNRDSLGLWSLSADTAGGTNYVLLDTVTDVTYNQSSYFGILCKYTSTRSDKFFFDDILISGTVLVDTVAPILQGVTVVNDTTLHVAFSELVTQASSQDIANFEILPDQGLPLLARRLSVNKTSVELSLPSTLQSKKLYQLLVNGVRDTAGNKAIDTLDFSFFEPEEGDLVINELMVDPLPVIGIPTNALPEREYIELHNRTQVPVNLEGWTLRIGTTEKPIPSYTIAPNGFVVLTKDAGVSEFPSSIDVLGMDISETALTNSGKTVQLLGPKGQLVFGVSYTDDWYADNNKDNGGWALEQVDPDNICGGIDNWKASIAVIGGTPGATNSVYGVNPDTTNPVLQRLAIAGDSAVTLFFSERVEPNLLLDLDNYWLNPLIEVASVEIEEPYRNKIKLVFKTQITSEQVYKLSLKEWPTDCSLNETKRDTLIFAIPSEPIIGDLLLSEVLFNPKSGGSDFIEIYNNSDKLFDLSKLRFSNWDAELEEMVDAEQLTELGFLLEPHGYYAFCTDKIYLQNNYILKDPDNVLEVEDLPSMNDDEGSIAIGTAGLEVLDYLEYSQGWHLAFIKDEEGISLERRDFAAETNRKDNWQSAAAAAGFATPGYENSQYVQVVYGAELTLSSKVFSPNLDGYQDVLTLSYQFKTANNVVSASVWTSTGMKLVDLRDKETVGQKGFITWDGSDEKGALQTSGIYIIVFEYFNANGENEIQRKSVVLSR